MKEAGRPVCHLPPASPAPTQCAGAPWPPSGPAARNASALPPAGLQCPVLWAVHTLCGQPEGFSMHSSPACVWFLSLGFASVRVP